MAAAVGGMWPCGEGGRKGEAAVREGVRGGGGAAPPDAAAHLGLHHHDVAHAAAARERSPEHVRRHTAAHRQTGHEDPGRTGWVGWRRRGIRGSHGGGGGGGTEWRDGEQTWGVGSTR